MQKDFKTLNTIYQNAEMGRDGISRLIKATEDTNLRNSLEYQLTQFQSIVDSSEQLLKEEGQEPDSVNPVSKMASTVMSNIKTTVDSTPSHIAGMLIKGCTISIDEINEQVSNAVTDQKIKDLSNQLIQVERANIEEMKKFI